LSAAKNKSGKGLGADQRLILIVLSVMVVLIMAVAVLAPKQSEDDPTPASTNTGPLGAKAAYLTLEGLGHKTSRWTKPLSEFNDSMDDAEAAKTTLVVLEPVYDATEEAQLKAQIKQFMGRGGQVLTTGAGGATLLGGKVQDSILEDGLCRTEPEGDSALAKAGKVQISDHGGWKLDDKQFAGDNLKVAQRCGKDAVVVSFTAAGTAQRGGAVWWSSAVPMTNVELKQDPALKLVVASFGEGRDVVFVESLHTVTRTLWDAAKGLPVGWVSWQAAALFALLILSFSRRRGPVRMPVTLPRSSPVEFATSMGDLYEKGGATSAVTEAAKRRLFRMLTREAGLAQDTVKGGPERMEEALLKRLGPGAKPVVERTMEHLREANEASHATVSAKSVLALVRALSEDTENIRAMLTPAKAINSVPEEKVVEELELAGAKERR
jgi:hypothetical protein